MLKTITFFLLLGLITTATSAQAQTSGCPDQRATNYNPAATINDGSCQYATTATAVTTKALLPAALLETSGLQYTSQSLWSFNDSGNSPVLFKLDSTTGSILQQVRITNFPNVDWEDIAADAQYLYVGDFGNNDGDRHNLRVLRVLKSAIGTTASESVTADAINFSYPDQTNFNPGNHNHNFDCEAVFYANDSLHLFTKNWLDLRTRYYTIPAQPGTYIAHLKGSFNVNGLVTAADLNPVGTGAALLGYNHTTGDTFMWLLSDFRNGQYLRGNKRRIELPNALVVGQAEGLCFVNNYRVFLSNEQVVRSIITIPQRLYALNTGRWLAPFVTTATAKIQKTGFTISPNPTRETIRIERQKGIVGELAVTLQDVQGRTIAEDQVEASSATYDFDVSAVEAGVYVLKIESASRTFSQKVEIR